MRVYLREMYPVPARLVTATLLYLSFTLILAAIQGQPPQWKAGWILLGGLGGFLVAFILRLMDELKDSQLDQKLFPERPVPSGRVTLTDIRVTLWAAAALFLLLHANAGAAFVSAVLLVTYSLFMFRYFFLPSRWKALLLVNLATHNPVVAVLLLHYVVLFALQYGIPFGLLRVEILVVLGMYWALLLSWELSRKVRYPEEETEYQTYSRIFGPFKAVVVAWGVQTVAVGAGVFLATVGGLSATYLLVLLAAYTWLIRGEVCFLARKWTSGRSLRATAEQFAGLVMSAAFIEFLFQKVWRHGPS